MLVGYMRVSSDGDRQTTALQRDALLAVGVDERHLFEDKASGARDDRPGLAAALVAGLKFLIPELAWTLQLPLFGVLAILTAVFWWRRQRGTGESGDQPNLNRRGHELIGRTFIVQQAIVEGRGKIKVGDSVWMAVGPDAPVGTSVRVTEQNGAVLSVEIVP